jgi:hypothetical protein
MKQITRGKTSDCLLDFFSRFGRVEALWKFTKVDSQTETRWRKNRTVPYGENLMRVMYFLDLVGYQVEELEKVSAELLELGRCISYDVITTDSVCKELNMDVQALYRYFRRGMAPSDERISAFAAIVSRNKAALDQVVSKRKKELQPFNISNAGLPAASKESPASNDLSEAVIAKFETHCAGIREFGGQLLNGPKEARVAMRRKMCEGLKPELQAAWQVLNNLLREQ